MFTHALKLRSLSGVEPRLVPVLPSDQVLSGSLAGCISSLRPSVVGLIVTYLCFRAGCVRVLTAPMGQGSEVWRNSIKSEI